MIEDPDRWAPAYVEAGAGSVTFHVEAAAAPVRLARELRAAGARAGMALKPATPDRALRGPAARAGHAAGDDGRARVRRPGVPGPVPAEDPAHPRRWSPSTASTCWLQVDGGVSLETIERCAEAGADVFVAGSAVFGADDPNTMIESLRSAAERPRRQTPDPARTSADPGVDARLALRPRGRLRHGAVAGLARRVNSSRALGSVQFRAGGESPRPGRSQQPVDQVELLDRR